MWHRLEQREGVEWPAAVTEQGGLVERELLDTGAVAEPVASAPVHRQRLVAAEHPPHEVAGADLGDGDEERVGVGDRCLGGRQHLVGFGERPELEQCLTDQQPDLGRHALSKRGPAEPLDLGEVLTVARQTGRPHEQS